MEELVLIFVMFPEMLRLENRGVNGAGSKRIMLISYPYLPFNEQIRIRIQIVNKYQNLKLNPP